MLDAGPVEFYLRYGSGSVSVAVTKVNFASILQTYLGFSNVEFLDYSPQLLIDNCLVIS